MKWKATVLPSAESALWGSGCAICFAAQQAKRELVSSGGVLCVYAQKFKPFVNAFFKKRGDHDMKNTSTAKLQI